MLMLMLMMMCSMVRYSVRWHQSLLCRLLNHQQQHNAVFIKTYLIFVKIAVVVLTVTDWKDRIRILCNNQKSSQITQTLQKSTSDDSLHKSATDCFICRQRPTLFIIALILCILQARSINLPCPFVCRIITVSCSSSTTAKSLVIDMTAVWFVWEQKCLQTAHKRYGWPQCRMQCVGTWHLLCLFCQANVVLIRLVVCITNSLCGLSAL